MLQQSPYHSARPPCVCSFSSRVQLIPVRRVEEDTPSAVHSRITTILVLSLLAIGLIHHASPFQSIVACRIHGTYILFRQSKFYVIKKVYVILMFISALVVTEFLTSTRPLLYPPELFF